MNKPLLYNKLKRSGYDLRELFWSIQRHMPKKILGSYFLVTKKDSDRGLIVDYDYIADVNDAMNRGEKYSLRDLLHDFKITHSRIYRSRGKDNVALKKAIKKSRIPFTEKRLG